jgi:UDP-glucose 4-epimerase
VKVLITGAGGFIGRNLLEQYDGRLQVAAPSRAELDLLDAEAVRAYLERHRFDAVIHAATDRSTRKLGSGPELLNRNCRMFFNLARNPHTFGRMLFLSSGAVYDRAHCRPRMSEADFDKCVPADDYGFSKYICAKAVDGMDRVYELRLFGVFGPYEDWQVRFISNACCRALFDMPVVMRQNVFFDYLDVEDLGRILECFATRRLGHKQYNICTGRTVDLQTLAEKVVAASGKALHIEVRNAGLGNEYSGDNSRMLAEIPGFPFRDLDESIARLYRWYEARKQTIDSSKLRFDG